MSFILDALKKAESERNRHVAPVLMDARIAPPRRGLPAWAWVVGVGVLANLAVLSWLLWRSPAPSALTAEPAATTSPVVPEPAVDAQPTAPALQSPAIAAPIPSPAIRPVPTTPSLVSGRRDDEASLPSAQELRAAGVRLPELQLNLHIFDPAPAHRSVLLNGVRLREGEYTPDGVKVERITPEAVVLEASGRHFRLDAGG